MKNKKGIWGHKKWGKKEFKSSYSINKRGQRLLNLYWQNPKDPANFMELTYDGWQAAKAAGWVKIG